MNQDENVNQKVAMEGSQDGKIAVGKKQNLRLAVRESDVLRTWKQYSEDLYYVDTEKQVVVNMLF